MAHMSKRVSSVHLFRWWPYPSCSLLSSFSHPDMPNICPHRLSTLMRLAPTDSAAATFWLWCRQLSPNRSNRLYRIYGVGLTSIQSRSQTNTPPTSVWVPWGRWSVPGSLGVAGRCLGALGSLVNACCGVAGQCVLWMARHSIAN